MREKRHTEIRQLVAVFEEAHARRREEPDELGAEVRQQLADYAATNKEGREGWRRQLAAIEWAKRGLEHQEGQDDKTS